MSEFACRSGCGACCIAPSINTPFFGMPQGKPAGVVCVHLTQAMACALFGQPERPNFCSGLAPSAEMCGATREQALGYLVQLEGATQPSAG